MAIIAINGKISSGKDEFCKRLQFNFYYKDDEFIKGKDIMWEDWCQQTHKSPFLVPSKKIKRHAFADKLKLCAAVILGINPEDYEDRNLKENYYVNLLTFELIHNTHLPKDALIINTPLEIEELMDNNKVEDTMWAKHRTFMLQFFGTETCRAKIPHIWVNSTFTNYKDGDNWIITDLRFRNEADFCKSKKDAHLIKIVRPDTDHLAGNAQSEIDLNDYDNFDTIIINDGTLEDFYKKIDEIFEILRIKFNW